MCDWSFSINLLSGAQYAWQKKDLDLVDRTVTPWLVAAWHPPWYNSYSSHYQEFECMRQEMEAILYQYGVDIIFSGHVSQTLSYPTLIDWRACDCNHLTLFRCLFIRGKEFDVK